MTVKFGKCAPV